MLYVEAKIRQILSNGPAFVEIYQLSEGQELWRIIEELKAKLVLKRVPSEKERQRPGRLQQHTQGQS